MNPLVVAEAETGRGGGERFPQDLTAAFGAAGGRCPALWVQLATTLGANKREL